MRLFRCIFCLAVCPGIILFTGVSASRADYDYINISHPFLNKIPLAVPLFKSMSDNAAEKEIARSAADFMAESLAFTGYFKLLDRAAFLSDLQKTGITESDIKFDNWTAVGAELLITGGVVLDGKMVEMEFRLFDTFKGEMLFGKRYRGRVDDQRRMVLRFCSEIIYRLTGKKGLFDSKIAFVSTTAGNKEIFVCDFDGKNLVQLTRTRSLTLFPTWSPDGSTVAYTSFLKGKPTVYMIDRDSSVEKVLPVKGIYTTPVWVPSTSLLAGTLSISGDEEIYVLTQAGKIVKRLTDSEGIDVSPSFSPDGTKMAFVSKRSGTPQIYIGDLKSETFNRLTYEGSYNTQPAWSPAGDRIAYSGMEDSTTDIYVISPSGKGLARLTSNCGHNESPSWSPDGSMIVFSSNRNGRAQIFVMTASGTDQRRLLDLGGEQTSPAWSPDLNR